MENIKKRKPREKRLTAFMRGAIIYAVCLVVIFAALIGVLSVFLHTYEVNLPERVAEKFARGLDSAALAALVEKAAGEIGEFEDSQLLIERTEHLSGEIKQAKLAKEYTSSAPVYRLICGDSDIGKLTLRRAEKNAAFGIARFEVDEAMLYAESVPGAIGRTSVRVCVPAGASLFANGKAVSESYITEKDSPYKGKTVTVAGTLCDIYVIDDLCLVPTLYAEIDCEVRPLTVSAGKADWFSEPDVSFTLTVPSDASVTVDGSTPSASLAFGGELTEAVSEFEKHLGDALPKMLSYTVYGMKDKCEIKVSVNGKNLEGEWFDGGKKVIYLYTDESKFGVRATVPSGAVLCVNGVDVSDEYLIGESTFEGLSSVKDIKGSLYEISGLLCEPVISAKIDGAEIPICSLSRTEQTFNAEFYGAETSDAGIKNAAEAFTRAYFHYVANGAVGIEENYNSLIGLVKPGSSAYKQLQRSKSSFEFVNQGVYRVDLIAPKNIIPLGSGLTFCQVDYSVLLRFYRNEKLYEGTLSLVFAKENDTNLVCDMVIDSDS